MGALRVRGGLALSLDHTLKPIYAHMVPGALARLLKTTEIDHPGLVAVSRELPTGHYRRTVPAKLAQTTAR